MQKHDLCTHCRAPYAEHRQVLGNACCPDGGNVFGARPPNWKPRRKRPRMCACGHPATTHDHGQWRCLHGADTKFGGCPCLRVHKRADAHGTGQGVATALKQVRAVNAMRLGRGSGIDALTDDERLAIGSLSGDE